MSEYLYEYQKKQIKEKLKEIETSIDSIYDNASFWHIKYAETQTPDYLDAEIGRLKEENAQLKARLSASFKINEQTEKDIDAWKEKHIAYVHSHAANTKVGRPYFYYSFYPTSLGDAGECICQSCERKALEQASIGGEFNDEVYHTYMTNHKAKFTFDDF